MLLARKNQEKGKISILLYRKYSKFIVWKTVNDNICIKENFWDFDMASVIFFFGIAFISPLDD